MSAVFTTLALSLLFPLTPINFPQDVILFPGQGSRRGR
jgi:hypothetical protein